MPSGDIAAKWAAFGWETIEVDGHDLEALIRALDRKREGKTKPLAVLARTVKGKGVSFMEHDNSWHQRAPSEEQYRTALAEIEGAVS